MLDGLAGTATVSHNHGLPYSGAWIGLFGKAVLGALGAVTLAHAASAEPATAQPLGDPASVGVSQAEIPFSAYASQEAREALAKQLHASPPPNPGTDINAVRSFNAKLDEDRLAKARLRYAVEITAERIAGVAAQVVTPKEGVAPCNRDRILINLHNGGFMWGGGPGGLVESVPIAAVGGFRVVTIDYRMAPEAKFPAASEDVAAVYRALLEHHRPQDIGLFGCSAGGILAAEAVAWFQAHGLPRPGAIASECGSGAEFAGDTAYVASILLGQPAVPPGGKPLLLTGLPYFQGVSPEDPLAFPAQSPTVLAGFPPTLLLAGSRDFAASSLTVMHRRLRAAGAQSELFLFDGLWHAFMLDVDLPESQEVYRVVSGFFDEHLGR